MVQESFDVSPEDGPRRARLTLDAFKESIELVLMEEHQEACFLKYLPLSRGGKSNCKYVPIPDACIIIDVSISVRSPCIS